MSTYVGDVMMPWHLTRLLTGISLGTAHAVDDESEKVEWVFQAPKTGSIEYVGIVMGAITTAPTANADVRVETVNTTTGDATGTLWATNTNVAWDMSGVIQNRLNKVGPLTANASVSQGDLLAVVYVPAASPDTGNVIFNGWNDSSYGFPYSRWYSGAAWSGGSLKAQAVLVYTDGTVVHPASFNSGNLALVSFNSTNTYNHQGVTMRSTVDLEVVGMWAEMDLDQDTTLKLISGTDTVERSCTLESDYRQQTGTQLVYGYFSSALTVQSGTDYKYVAYTASTSDIALTAPRMYFDGYSGITITNSHPANVFTNVDGERGEITTPTWTSLGGGVWPLIGPIVRRIG